MKWGEFKKIVEKKGVTNDMEIWYIDLSLPEPKHLKIELPIDGDEDSLGVCITS